MRHVDGRHAHALEQVTQLDAHLLPQLGIEVRQRLVQQHHGRAADQRAGDRHALLLATRELRGAAVVVVAQAHHVQRLAHLFADLFTRQLLDVQREGHVLAHAHVGPDRIGLEHHRDVAPMGGNVGLLQMVEDHLARDADAPGGGRLQAGDAAQRGGLAAAARTQQREELAGLDVQRHAPHGGLGRSRIGEPEVLNFYHACLQFLARVGRRSDSHCHTTVTTVIATTSQTPTAAALLGSPPDQ